MQGQKWFGPKRVGWGVRPIHPMGWLVLIIFIGAIAAGLHLLLTGLGKTLGIGILALAIVLMIVIVALKFERGET